MIILLSEKFFFRIDKSMGENIMKKKNKTYYQQAAKWLEARAQDAATLYLRDLILNYGNMACSFLQERMSFSEFCAIESEAARWAVVLHVNARCKPSPPFAPSSRYSR